MSRRQRESYTPDPSLTDDELLAQMFGELSRRRYVVPMDGCDKPCCRSGVWAAVEEAEARLRRALWVGLAITLGSVVAVLAVVGLAWRLWR